MATEITKGLIGDEQVQFDDLEPSVQGRVVDAEANINFLLNNQAPPPPQTGSATFSLSIGENTLNWQANIDVGTSTATRVYIADSTEAAPTTATDGTAVTWTGVKAFPSQTYAAALSAYGTAETKQAWAYISSAWVQALDSNGNTTIDILANDTNAPSWTGVTVALTANTTNPSTQIDVDVTGTPTDNQSGIAQYDLIDFDTGNPILLDVDISATITVDVVPGTYTWQISATDNNDNTSYSNEDVVTISSGSAGSISFTAASFTGTEASGKAVVTLQRTGGSTGEVTVDVSTLDDTALGGVNYTAVSSETLTWADGDSADKTVDTDGVEITDATSALNNQFFCQIDYGSETGGATVISPNSVTVLITGSGGGTAGFLQESSGNYLAVAEAENGTFNAATAAGQTSDKFQVVSPDGRASGGASISPNNTHTYGNATTIDYEANSADYVFNFTQTGAHDVFMRGEERTGSVGNIVHGTLLRPLVSIGADDSGTGGAGFRLVICSENHSYSNGDDITLEGTALDDGTYAITDASNDVFDIPNTGNAAEADASAAYAMGDTGLIGFYFPTVASAVRKWVHQNSGSTDRTVTIPAAGSWTLRFYQQEYDTHPDKICIAPTSVSYDPNNDDSGLGKGVTADDYYGPVESTLVSSSDPVDNPDNSPTAPPPLPSTSVDPTAVIPTVSQSNVSITTSVSVQFSGMTLLAATSFTISTAGTNISTSTISQSSNTASISPSSPLSYITTYTARFVGTVSDGGTLKSVDYSWNFTTLDNNAASTIINANMSTGNFSAGRLLSSADLNTLWNRAQTFTNVANGTYIASDPGGTGRGNVLRIHKNINTAGHTYQVLWPISGSSYDELYYSEDMYFPVGFQFPPSIHMGGLIASNTTNVQTTPNAGYAQIWFNMFSGSKYNNRPPGSVGIYYYNSTTRNQLFCNTVDPVNRIFNSSSQVGQLILNPGSWHRMEMRMKLSTNLIQVWHNGTLVMNTTAINWGLAGGIYINVIKSGDWVGGSQSDPTFWMPATGDWYKDNIIASTSKIT